MSSDQSGRGSLNPKDDPDVVLMLAFKAGDYNAFATLVERHGRGLLNYFFLQSRDVGLAEDCTQEVWVRVFKSRTQYRPRARFRTFLYSVARNLWIDTYRAARRKPPELGLQAVTSELPLRDSGHPESELDPLQQLLNKELVQALAAAVSRLPEEMAEVFLLGEVEGLCYRDVARILGIPVGTVKSRMFHAIRRLRVLLGSLEGKEDSSEPPPGRSVSRGRSGQGPKRPLNPPPSSP